MTLNNVRATAVHSYAFAARINHAPADTPAHTHRDTLPTHAHTHTHSEEEGEGERKRHTQRQKRKNEKKKAGKEQRERYGERGGATRCKGEKRCACSACTRGTWRGCSGTCVRVRVRKTIEGGGLGWGRVHRRPERGGSLSGCMTTLLFFFLSLTVRKRGKEKKQETR